MSVASGLTVRGTSRLAVGQQQSTNELHLVETGLTFQPHDPLDIEHRMPVDSSTKYRTVADGIIPTQFADEQELRRLRNDDRVLSNGRIRAFDGTYAKQTETNKLPLELWNGRQPVDAALVTGTVQEPEYDVSTDGTDVTVTSAGKSVKVPVGEISEMTFGAQTYSVVKHVSVETNNAANNKPEGEEVGYETVKRTRDRTFVPTIRIRNRGTVDVLDRGDGQ